MKTNNHATMLNYLLSLACANNYDKMDGWFEYPISLCCAEVIVIARPIPPNNDGEVQFEIHSIQRV